MDDVVRHVVIAVGDENLLAEHAVGAVGLRLGAGTDEREVGTGLRLGKVHRAGPFAGHHLFQEDSLEFVAGAGQQRLDGAGGEQGAEAEGHVGGTEHFLDGDAQGVGQALTTEIGRQRDAVPAGFAVLVISFFPASRRGDAVGRQLAAFLVAHPVERGQHFAGEFRGFIENGLGQIGRRFFKTGHGTQFLETGQLFHDKTHVLHGRTVVTH